VGMASVNHGETVVSACVVVNAVGDVLNTDGSVLAGARRRDGSWFADGDPVRSSVRSHGAGGENTTLAVVMTNARLSKVDVNRVAQRGHDGMARAIKPVHTMHDGDLVFALASGIVDVNTDVVAELGADMITEAIRSAVLRSTLLGGVEACRPERTPG